MARSLAERLRALKASVGAEDLSVEAKSTEDAGGAQAFHAGTTIPSPIAPSSLQTSEAVETSTSVPSAHSELRDQGFSEIAPGVWWRSVRYDVLMRHGDLRFTDLLEADLTRLQKLSKVPSGDPIKPLDIRFYDTETTGLGTGAGTFPFLHAVGRFEEDEFVVHQYFLADYGGESQLLSALLEQHFSEGTAVISFNGKSFDWPLLSTRLTLHRMKPPFVRHLDLLYPSRRLWRKMMPRVSLGAVESAVLGLERADDLPGKEAPMRYFEYVDKGGLHRLVPVFEHNATDVCSLVTLTSRLAEILTGHREVVGASEWSALGRMYDEWNESNLAAHCFHESVSRPDASWREHWLQSLYCKRQGAFDAAVHSWNLMAQKYPWSVPPCVEMAKVYEHRTVDLASALFWAKEAKLRAVRNLRAGVPGVSIDDRIVQALNHRLARIERKLSASVAQAGVNGCEAIRTSPEQPQG
jgi:uncharacterized protein